MKKGPRTAPREESLVIEVHEGKVNLCLLGTTPYLANRMSTKAKRSLLYPEGRKNTAQKQGSMKHDPLAEYRAAPTILRADDEPTLIAHPATGFKKAMCTAALDLPGMKKAQIGRLVHVIGEHVGLYGVPRLHMAPVRSADMNRTPDIRTRAILPEWACYLSIRFVTPILRERMVVQLLAAAGMYIGVGDFRSEKGAGDYGCFRICPPDDPSFRRLIKTAGRKAQAEALDEPTAYDEETEDLWSWYRDEVERRGGGPAVVESADEPPDGEETES